MLKKKWGQHLLNSQDIARQIVESFLEQSSNIDCILEIGPGRGALTGLLIELSDLPVYVLEIDPDMHSYLKKKFDLKEENLIRGDFLEMNVREVFGDKKVGLIGNFPYNISGAIQFKVIHERDTFPLVTGMFQKEVAQRLTAGEGSKVYGITSVLSAIFFERKYLFSVKPGSFTPPPKVQSGVIQMVAHQHSVSPQIAKKLETIVKKAFGKRRKKLKNSLNEELLQADENFREQWQSQRPEQIPPEVYLELAGILTKN